MQAAVYIRVSTEDKGQDTENQLIDLRKYCESHGWESVVYEDHETAKHGNREAFKRLFIDASRRKFGVVVVWALDRFTREGILETFEYIKKLSTYGVQFESYTEAHFRTTGQAGELMLAVAAWIAKQERLRISERTKAGMERVRRQGKELGRPRLVVDRLKARELHEAGESLASVAQSLGVSKSTAARLVKASKSGVFA